MAPLHVVDRVVDDRVEPDLDLVLLGERAGLAGRADVEADDDRLRRDGEVDVALGDGADGGVDDREADFLGRSLASASATASTEPCTSPLMMTRSSCCPASGMRLESSSSDTLAVAGMRLLAIFPRRLSAISWAFFGSFTACIGSPAPGTSDRPRISTGVDGPASWMFLPCSFVIARTLPKPAPARMKSPTRSVPSWTRTRATGPRPRSRRASSTVPLAAASGWP